MKKILICFLILFLVGCIDPKFYGNTQQISFEYPHPLNEPDTMNLKLDQKDEGEEIEVIEDGSFSSDMDGIMVTSMDSLNVPKYQIKDSKVVVDRSFSSITGTLSKKGFKDKKIKIKSHFTADKWATFMLDFHVSGAELIPLYSTVVFTGTGAIVGTVSPLRVALSYDKRALLITPVSFVLGTIAGFTIGLTNDIKNLVSLSLLRVLILNPWYEYDEQIDLTKEILEPTVEFETQCHDKKEMFIGDNDCLSCQIVESVVSTQEECLRCPDREWENFVCRLKNEIKPHNL